MRESRFILARCFVPFALVFLTQVCTKACPQNCICYTDYLSNLASWKWIDPLATSFKDSYELDNNPFLKHNEVLNDPLLEYQRKVSGERTVATATCIIRKNETSALSNTIKDLDPKIQVLSILQAPGSGKLTLESHIISRFPDLIGLELQGVPKYEENVNEFHLNADSLQHNQNLKYLNLERIIIHDKPANKEFVPDEVYIKVNSVTSDGNTEISHEIRSQLLYVVSKDEPEVEPYEEYKKHSGNDSTERPPLLPKARQNDLIEPKISVAFTQLSNLVHLRISQCEMPDITWDMFYKLNKLKFLLLDKNELLFLPDFVFYATPNLTALSLSGNRILNLQTVGLAGLLYLEKLDVTNNNITHLSELSLPPFPHLQVADFRFNPIETIFPNTFEIMNTTHTLLIGSRSTQLELSPNSFFGLKALKRLEILNVKISTLERPMLKGMPQLRTLVMDGTLSRISFDAFREVPKLENLVLRNCKLEKISMDAFYGINALVDLDLSHNELTFIPPGLLDDQVSLREVYLSHNNLRTLPVGVFDRVPAKLIRLDHNPWHCTCEMKDWNPKVINQVKTYHIIKNETTCQPQYDKGSMCDPSSSGLKIKYVYEKRVAPTCASPIKHKSKSVFQVVQRGLHKCAGEKQKSNPEKPKKAIKLNPTKKKAQLPVISGTNHTENAIFTNQPGSSIPDQPLAISTGDEKSLGKSTVLGQNKFSVKRNPNPKFKDSKHDLALAEHDNTVFGSLKPVLSNPILNQTRAMGTGPLVSKKSLKFAKLRSRL